MRKPNALLNNTKYAPESAIQNQRELDRTAQ